MPYNEGTKAQPTLVASSLYYKISQLVTMRILARIIERLL